MIEIPFTTSTADKTFIGYPYPMRGGPDGLTDVWNSEFDVLYRESEHGPRFMILSIQTWATGRPAPLRTLKQFIERLAGIQRRSIRALRRNRRLVQERSRELSGKRGRHVDRNSAETAGTMA